VQKLKIRRETKEYLQVFSHFTISEDQKMIR
jgi:hypothetical protein